MELIRKTVPLAVAPSTNDVLLASVSPISIGITSHPPTVHTFPILAGLSFRISCRTVNSPTIAESLAQTLACALMARKSCVDVVHVIRGLPLDAVHDVLMATRRLLPDTESMDAKVLRLAVEAHSRAGPERVKDERLAGLDLCYLLGCASLFRECSEDGAWDVSACLRRRLSLADGAQTRYGRSWQARGGSSIWRSASCASVCISRARCSSAPRTTVRASKGRYR